MKLSSDFFTRFKYLQISIFYVISVALVWFGNHFAHRKGYYSYKIIKKPYNLITFNQECGNGLLPYEVCHLLLCKLFLILCYGA